MIKDSFGSYALSYLSFLCVKLQKQSWRNFCRKIKILNHQTRGQYNNSYFMVWQICLHFSINLLKELVKIASKRIKKNKIYGHQGTCPHPRYCQTGIDVSQLPILTHLTSYLLNQASS
jgi:hypothetical protein